VHAAATRRTAILIIRKVHANKFVNVVCFELVNVNNAYFGKLEDIAYDDSVV
jgi:hypothetical protein